MVTRMERLIGQDGERGRYYGFNYAQARQNTPKTKKARPVTDRTNMRPDAPGKDEARGAAALARMALEIIRTQTIDAASANLLSMPTGSVPDLDCLRIGDELEQTARDAMKLADSVRARQNVDHEKDIDHIRVDGIGGSYLGAQAAFAALCHPLHNELPAHLRRDALRMVFGGYHLSDELMIAQTHVYDPRRGILVYTSKSGGTPEPATDFAVTVAQMQKVGLTFDEIKDRVIVITDPSKGGLRRLATEQGFKTFDVPEAFGGRFSVPCAVGLVPMAFAGIDAVEFLSGVRGEFDILLAEEDVDVNPAAQTAIAISHAIHTGSKVLYIYAYDPALYATGQWLQQLLDESVGGKGIDFPDVNVGRGPTDNHSVWQQRLSKETARWMTTIFWALGGQRVNPIQIPEPYPGMGTAYLAQLGNTVQRERDASLLSTQDAFTAAGGRSMLEIIPEMTAHNYGRFIGRWIFTTIVLSYMLGVNPFGQDNVEKYKSGVGALMGDPKRPDAVLADRLGRRASNIRAMMDQAYLID